MPETIHVKSSAFADDRPIPEKYTQDAQNVSPPVEWNGVPDGTREFALICDDPDAPMDEPYVHWVIYKIPRETTTLRENVPVKERLDRPNGALQGVNSSDKLGYDGPAPPEGHGTHHYHFKVYALDRELDVGPGATKDELLDAMRGHILGEGETIGTYER